MPAEATRPCPARLDVDPAGGVGFGDGLADFGLCGHGASIDRKRPPRVRMCRQFSKVASLESATYAALRIMPSLFAKSQVRAVSVAGCSA